MKEALLLLQKLTKMSCCSAWYSSKGQDKQLSEPKMIGGLPGNFVALVQTLPYLDLWSFLIDKSYKGWVWKKNRLSRMLWKNSYMNWRIVLFLAFYLSRFNIKFFWRDRAIWPKLDDRINKNCMTKIYDHCTKPYDRILPQHQIRGPLLYTYYKCMLY